MKNFIKSTFIMHFSIVFMSFIVFSTNEFTLSHPIVNVIASLLLIGIYLVVFYSDAFKITTIHIRNKAKAVTPVLSWILLYIIPVILLVWFQVAPIEYYEWMPEETEAVEVTENNSEPQPEKVTLKRSVTGIRQQAWFELYMQPYKGLYHLTGNGMTVYIISLLFMPIASLLGYVNAKRGKDFMKKAGKKFDSMMYRQEDEL